VAGCVAGFGAGCVAVPVVLVAALLAPGWDQRPLTLAAVALGQPAGIVLAHRWLALPWRPLLVFLVPVGLLATGVRAIYGSSEPPVLIGIVLALAAVVFLALAVLVDPGPARPTTDSTPAHPTT